MQIQVFVVRPGDGVAMEELNSFLRGHRVLSVDREFQEGLWHFCVCSQSIDRAGQTMAPGAKVDYRQILDSSTFTLFSKLRELRKALAEKEGLPPYAVLTNEQMAEVARRRPVTVEALREIPGVGESRVERYGAAFYAVISDYAKQLNSTGGHQSTGTSA